MTRVCTVCGNSDRLLKTVAGILLCVNTERCDNDVTAVRAQLVVNQLRRDQTDPPAAQSARRAALADDDAWWRANRKALAEALKTARA